MKTDGLQDIEAHFKEIYGYSPEFIVRAPGRVNLIGEHTDYNDGFVFPAAIDYEVRIAGAARAGQEVRLHALNEGISQPSTTFFLDQLTKSTDAAWSNYTRSVAQTLKAEGFTLKGMDAVLIGTVPIGSGLSSSAAIEMASSLAFESAGGFLLEPVKRALLGQQAEWNPQFVGVRCGIMDQFISALGHADHALFIDTRNLKHEAVPLPASGLSLLISNTNVKHQLAGDNSAYNKRREECEQAVKILRNFLSDIKALRDVNADQFRQYAKHLPEPVRRRARHVISENMRVTESVAALKAGNITLFGQLMNESHDSLRDDYEVSCRELDVMVSAAREVKGVFGSRLTGAGFGGCTISLVENEAVEAFKAQVGGTYKVETGREATFYVCHASEGASRLK